jgi:hypothetical protein
MEGLPVSGNPTLSPFVPGTFEPNLLTVLNMTMGGISYGLANAEIVCRHFLVSAEMTSGAGDGVCPLLPQLCTSFAHDLISILRNLRVSF